MLCNLFKKKTKKHTHNQTATQVVCKRVGNYFNATKGNIVEILNKIQTCSIYKLCKFDMFVLHRVVCCFKFDYNLLQFYFVYVFFECRKDLLGEIFHYSLGYISSLLASLCCI